MSNIAQIQSSDTFDYQRRRINDAIDIVNSMGGGIAELESEANLPDPSTATSNIYLIRNHSKFKGAALAALINGVYKISPLKNDVMNSNQFIYVDNAKLASSVTINKCVYLDSTGVWQLANSSDSNKYAQGIVGPYNSIILGGILYSPSLNLSVGATYYYDNNGNLTLTPTIGKAGVAIDTNVLSLHFLSINTEVQDIETAVNYNNITNCLTKVPQNLKLELAEDGSNIVLKSGSTVWYPDGLDASDKPKFKKEVLTRNVTIYPTGGSGQVIGCIGYNVSSGACSGIKQCITSSTSSTPLAYGLYYNINTNIANRYGEDINTPTISNCSLPLFVATQTDGKITSIEQVFNDLGCMDTIIFAIQDIEGLISDGFNSDGGLNNRTVKLSQVVVKDYSTTGGDWDISLTANTFGLVKATYDPTVNKIYNYNGDRLVSCIAGKVSLSSGKVISLTPKTAFHAVDYNDFENVTRVVSKTNNGLVPQLPNETTVKKFLRQDGTWAEPPESLLKSGGAMTGTLSDVSAAQVRNIVILSEEQDTGVDGTIYMVIEEY